MIFMQSAPIDLNWVRSQFSRNKNRTASEFICREIASRMFERLQLVKLNPTRIVDAGCGRGADLARLKNNYTDAHLVGIDASLSQLRQAKKELIASPQWMQRLFFRMRGQGRVAPAVDLVCSDFCQTPLGDLSADLVWSNMALHWHSEPDQVFKEWHRVLRTHGLLMFSCFGPDSLKEIRYAFEGIDQFPHTLPFVDMHDFGDMLISAGLATPVMDMEMITLTYTSVQQLMNEVRTLGGNPLQTRRKGLTGKGVWDAARARLEKLRNADGRIPLTFEIIYGHAFKPEMRRKNPGESIIRFS